MFGSSWILEFAIYPVLVGGFGLCASESSERTSSSVSDGETRTKRRSLLYSDTGSRMGSCSIVPLFWGSSLLQSTIEPLSSLATEISSSSTVGGGGRRLDLRLGKDLGTFVSFGSRGSSLEDWLARTRLDLPGRCGIQSALCCFATLLHEHSKVVHNTGLSVLTVEDPWPVV